MFEYAFDIEKEYAFIFNNNLSAFIFIGDELIKQYNTFKSKELIPDYKFYKIDKDYDPIKIQKIPMYFKVFQPTNNNTFFYLSTSKENVEKNSIGPLQAFDNINFIDKLQTIDISKFRKIGQDKYLVNKLKSENNDYKLVTFSPFPENMKTKKSVTIEEVKRETFNESGNFSEELTYFSSADGNARGDEKKSNWIPITLSNINEGKLDENTNKKLFEYIYPVNFLTQFHDIIKNEIKNKDDIVFFYKKRFNL